MNKALSIAGLALLVLAAGAGYFSEVGSAAVLSVAGAFFGAALVAVGAVRSANQRGGFRPLAYTAAAAAAAGGVLSAVGGVQESVMSAVVGIVIAAIGIVIGIFSGAAGKITDGSSDDDSGIQEG